MVKTVDLVKRIRSGFFEKINRTEKILGDLIIKLKRRGGETEAERDRGRERQRTTENEYQV